ncbi:beta-N-acetylglucosaminidase domain-containing protein [Streptomyces albus]|uniref:beta-N-acetylglucosaminidase domain-containing protein n=1 Tax=Streptomyces albus TaxID=1888 RepID=UPI00068BB112|nr:beta-N-acetylglucosaminidase domain-containing protein [Streptomyces albus]
MIGGLVGTAPGAAAAPAPAGDTAPTAEDRKDDASVPSVWPRPQDLSARGKAVRVTERVALVSDENTDPYALDALHALLRSAGAREVLDVRPDAELPPDALVVRADARSAAEALRALRAPSAADLPSGGYRLAVGRTGGRDTVALAGRGTDGLFHAVQTLRQLVISPGGRDDGGDRDTADRAGHSFAGVIVRDWPGTAVRGIAESFYGTPWTRGQRLEQIDFLGRTKQNRYLYAAGDDPYRQTRWRDPYPAGQRGEFRALAERARANHVTLGWAVAPGQALCFSSDDDLKALTRKIDAMWALGVRAFQLQFQDVSYSEWHCDADARRFGSGPEAAARAQARVANAVAEHLAERHPGAVPLSVMPTEYYQKGATAYRGALAGALRREVEVVWTGVGVVPKTITGGELADAREAFRHPIVTLDNYPVNDFAQDRLFLGPYRGREPGVAVGSAALLANAMAQPAASRVPLFTAADFSWNPRGYRPQESWQAAVDALAGPDARSRQALGVLAAHGSSSGLGGKESAYLRPLIDALWTAHSGGDREELETAGERLREAFRVMGRAPDHLSGPAGEELAADGEAGPWLAQLARYGRAGERAVEMLLAQARGNGAAAWRAQLELRELRKEIAASPATVGEGVLDPFLKKAAGRADAWTGADRARPREAHTERPGELRVDLGGTRPLAAVTVLSEPDRGAGAVVEAHVPGEGWRSLGRLSGEGWTQLGGEDVRADTVRLTWERGEPAPEVRGVVPWFADLPDARLDLARGETDVTIGGEERIPVELTAERPADVRGRLVAVSPEGIDVKVPQGVTVRRGTKTEVPVTVSVPEGTPAGSYEVPFDFAGEKRTLTVRAFPGTGGPDLARGATARSSGDETPDFPASAAVDGDPATRWSSPAEDNAWFQIELARPARVGRVVLHWQDAYAARYRVQVSSDGRVWRDAAAVGDGRGGREEVRMDAPETRFIRVQGEKRATRYGYSLFSVEAYAVAR